MNSTMLPSVSALLNNGVSSGPVGQTGHSHNHGHRPHFPGNYLLPLRLPSETPIEDNFLHSNAASVDNGLGQSMRNGMPEPMIGSGQPNVVGAFNSTISAGSHVNVLLPSMSMHQPSINSSYMAAGMSLGQNVNTAMISQEFSMSETHMKMHG